MPHLPLPPSEAARHSHADSHRRDCLHDAERMRTCPRRLKGGASQTRRPHSDVQTPPHFGVLIGAAAGAPCCRQPPPASCQERFHGNARKSLSTSIPTLSSARRHRRNRQQPRLAQEMSAVGGESGSLSVTGGAATVLWQFNPGGSGCQRPFTTFSLPLSALP